MITLMNVDKAAAEVTGPCSLTTCSQSSVKEATDELQYIQLNPEGADLMISALYAALTSYRRASVCKPFPSRLFSVGQNDKDFKTPATLLDTLPATPLIASSALSPHLQQLLHWLFIEKGKGRGFKSVPSTTLNPQLPHCCSWPPDPNNPSLHPDLVLQLQDPTIPPLSPPPHTASASNTSPPTPAAHTSSHTPPPSAIPSTPTHSNSLTPTPEGPYPKSLLAFHGTSLENLHSILHHGLLNLSGTSLQRSGSLFGEGIYLSTDYRTAHNYSHPGPTWPSSLLGRRIRCILVCEMDVGEGSLGSKVLTGLEPKGASNRMPQTYWLVKSPDAVRVRYILIFRDSVQPQHVSSSSRRMLSLRSVNWALLLPVLYVLFMLLLGLKR